VSATDRFYEDAGVVDRYRRLDELFAEELRILERLRNDLPRMRMLDIGVGAGRTTPSFAPLVRSYVGADYSTRMIEACKARFAREEWPHVRFEVADVRAMSQFDDGEFDFVLFSFNGLDGLIGGHGERARALAEIRRVCAPGGAFAFSSHNLGAVSEELSFRKALAPPASTEGGRPPLPRARALIRTLLLRALNPRLGRSVRHECALLINHRHGLRPMRMAYFRPEAQLRKLERTGFRDACVVTKDGIELRHEREVAALREEWVHYLCWA
jgi:ubiquinone/menaquinone biosynthesis C-methylase UbiE